MDLIPECARGEFMSSKRKYLILIPSFLVATSLILSACQDNGQSRVRVAKSKGDGKKVEEAMKKAELSAVQKEHVKDPLTLEPYQQVLAPIFSKMDADALAPWSSLFKLKRWIIYANDIKKEADASISVSSTANFGYFARQTMYDIFIDDGIYSKRTVNEKADIILNEFLTALYTYKNFSDEELCKLVKDEYKDADCLNQKKADAEVDLADTDTGIVAPETDDLESADAKEKSDKKKSESQKKDSDGDKPKSQLDSASTDPKAEKENEKATAARRNDLPKKNDTAKEKDHKALERDDYLNIEKVKKHILETATLSHAALVTVLRENGFDLRIFSIKIKQEPKSNNSLVLEKESIDSLFSQTKDLNESKHSCYFVRSGEHAECQVKLKVSENEDERTLLSINLKVGEKEKFLKEMVYKVSGVISTMQVNPVNKKDTYLVPLGGFALQDSKEGAAYRVNYFVATKAVVDSKETWSLDGILSLPGAVTKFDSGESGDGGTCKGKLAELKGHESDVILIADSDENVNLIKTVVGKIKTLRCW